MRSIRHPTRSRSRLCIAKHPRIIDRYAELIADLDPRVIVEVGILDGASIALFADLAKPDRLVAIEYDKGPFDKLQAFIDHRGLQDVVEVHGGVDQADTDGLAAIVGDGPLDLVVDDASHLYGPSRATFHCLFPRLRPGGVYVLEDWATSLRHGSPAQLEPGDRPLVDLVFEIITAKGREPGSIHDITVRSGVVTIVRGQSA